ncbi:hypothetical protein LK10_18780 [Sinomonas humi]|uniref:ScyD/ScyE family protein n=1 Tax=Sinomonas humi TaxID=1338436 RepID=A0A0B2AGL5_9MICC|nr:hypothetical protein LK10_18780 [Sinomonas humi]
MTVSEEFAGRLTRVSDETSRTVYSAPEWDVAGSDAQGSTTYFVESQGAGPDDPRPLAGSLKSIDAKGTVRTVTDQLGAFETANNPDGNVAYGVPATAPAECLAQLGSLGVPASYTGETDSHPYAVAVSGNTAYVADAGGNDLLAVNLTTGSIRKVAVLPGASVPVTSEIAAALGAPACAGQTYTFEPVPTDVAIGPDGWLYVSSLPGGPEDASLGANGSILRVNPWTGAAQRWVDGLVSPTGIAFDGRGNLFVASLFGPGIYRVPAGTATPSLFLDVAQPADVAVSGNTLYATTEALGNGALIAVRLEP